MRPPGRDDASHSRQVETAQIQIVDILDPNAPACEGDGNTQRNSGSISHSPYASNDNCAWTLKCQGVTRIKFCLMNKFCDARGVKARHPV